MRFRVFFQRHIFEKNHDFDSRQAFCPLELPPLLNNPVGSTLFDNLVFFIIFSPCKNPALP